MRQALTITGLLGLAILGAGQAPAQPSALPPLQASQPGCPSDPAAVPAWPESWSLRRRLVHLAVCEWARFGYPVVEIRRSDARSSTRLPGALGLEGALTELPQPPAYDGVHPVQIVQTRGAVTSSDPGVAPAILAYWAATDPDYVARLQAARATLREAHPRADGAEPAELYPGWWRPWSAAFISWAMTSAQVPWFRASEWHTLYLARSTEAHPDRLVRIEDYRPVPGDLVCFGRTGASGPQGLPTSHAFIDRVRAIRTADDAFPGHCDIVVRVNRSSVVTIGGNVRSAVSATVTPLVAGRFLRSNPWPWSAALRMEGPEDPCARIEAVPAGPWSGETAATARRRALRSVRC